MSSVFLFYCVSVIFCLRETIAIGTRASSASKLSREGTVVGALEHDTSFPKIEDVPPNVSAEIDLNANMLMDFFQSDATPAKSFIDAVAALRESNASCIIQWSLADDKAKDLWSEASNVSGLFTAFARGDIGFDWKNRYPALTKTVSEIAELRNEMKEMHKQCMVAEPFRHFDFVLDDSSGSKLISTANLRLDEAAESRPMIIHIYASF